MPLKACKTQLVLEKEESMPYISQFIIMCLTGLIFSWIEGLLLFSAIHIPSMLLVDKSNKSTVPFHHASQGDNGPGWPAGSPTRPKNSEPHGLALNKIWARRASTNRPARPTRLTHESPYLKWIGPWAPKLA
jgi:hypothetical protein